MINKKSKAENEYKPMRTYGEWRMEENVNFDFIFAGEIYKNLELSFNEAFWNGNSVNKLKGIF